MRKVNLAAVQGSEPDFFDLSNVNEIIDKNVMPRINLQAELLGRCEKPGVTLALSNEDICGLSRYLTDDAGLFNELTVKSSQRVEECISKLAKEKQMYVAACYFKRMADKNYNVVSIFGPCGQILGDYKKTHLPPNEMWQAVDGDELNVIELNFGKIGVLICYDIMFPEAASVLSLKGAEIILHPTAGDGWYDSIGEATLRTRANDNSVYILTAKNYIFNGAGNSSVIDYWGQVLADAGFYKDATVSKTIDLDVKKVQPDWFYQTQMSGIADMKMRNLQERRPELYNRLCEPAQRLRVPDENERNILKEKIKSGGCRW